MTDTELSACVHCGAETTDANSEELPDGERVHFRCVPEWEQRQNGDDHDRN